MRLRLFAAALGMLACSLAVHADSYTINFQASSGAPVLPTGFFDYDGTTFSNFVVNFAGIRYDFTSLANQGFGQAQDPNSTCQTGSTFHFLSATGVCAPVYIANQNYSYNPQKAIGTYFSFAIEDVPPGQTGPYVSHTIAEIDLVGVDPAYPYGYGRTTITDIGPSPAPSAVTPEPSSLALLGTGVLGVFGAARRRFIR